MRRSVDVGAGCTTHHFHGIGPTVASGLHGRIGGKEERPKRLGRCLIRPSFQPHSPLRVGSTGELRCFSLFVVGGCGVALFFESDFQIGCDKTDSFSEVALRTNRPRELFVITPRIADWHFARHGLFKRIFRHRPR